MGPPTVAAASTLIGVPARRSREGSRGRGSTPLVAARSCAATAPAAAGAGALAGAVPRPCRQGVAVGTGIAASASAVGRQVPAPVGPGRTATSTPPLPGEGRAFAACPAIARLAIGGPGGKDGEGTCAACRRTGVGAPPVSGRGHGTSKVAANGTALAVVGSRTPPTRCPAGRRRAGAPDVACSPVAPRRPGVGAGRGAR